MSKITPIIKQKEELLSYFPESLAEDVTEDDEALFFSVVSTTLNSDQIARIVSPKKIFSKQRYLLAIHWHPEFIPMELIRKRVEIAFPAVTEKLIIPTQHNQLLEWDNYAGVEVDCYSSEFNQKVQLLLHFRKEKVTSADCLKSMLEYTFKYRATQLFSLIEALTKPDIDIINMAAKETGAEDALIQFVRVITQKIKLLIEKHESIIPPEMIKNKILRNYFDELRGSYTDRLIDKCQAFLKAVKTIVKANFPLRYFYRTSEVIEEARALGAGIVIPHPEQFWPILLADYDLDGYEVWNPQSRKYTDFLISVVNRRNGELKNREKRILIFMGDDTHFGEKTKSPSTQDPQKALRELGYQPAWEDLTIKKKLILAEMTRDAIIEEYKARLDG